MIILGIILLIGAFAISCAKKQTTIVSPPPPPPPAPAPEIKRPVAPLPSPPIQEKEEPSVKIKEVQELPVEATARGVEFEFAENITDIFFDYDKSQLTDQSKETLRKNAEWLKNNPNVKIMIEGHCDERGTIEYNLALGERRALSTRNYLAALGIDPALIFTISYGEERPFELGHNEEAWAQNRRAHFVIAKE